MKDEPFAPDPAVITIRGAREHNLKNIDVLLPRNQLVVVTGVSGSGKSTLAFDLLFAEGQRRFLDSMNTYARQFVEQMSRPDVDLIAGVPPTVSIEQSTTRGGGKSTVGTVTEIHHFVRLLYARLGTQFCPDCGVAVAPQTRDQVRDALIQSAKKRGCLRLLAPLVKNRKGFHSDVAHWALRQGFDELRADGIFHNLSEPFRLDRFKEHDIEVVVGEVPPLPVRGEAATRLRESVDRALTIGKGVVFALDRRKKLTVHSTERACPQCMRSFTAPDPKDFSYNSSQGWCPKCRGFGELFYLPDVDRGANADAIEESWFHWQEGKREKCPECQGARLRPEPRAVRLLGLGGRGATMKDPTIDDFGTASVAMASSFVESLKLDGRTAEIARDIVPEIRERLKFLCEVGLDYLQLGRSMNTLSGGEGQRIRLAAQLGSNLSGVLYVLDEPTIGLHSRDNDQLLKALIRLRDRGNSLVVVEHDEETMRCADHIIDLGPGAGVQGGRVVATGPLIQLLDDPESITGRTIRNKPAYPSRGLRRPVASPGKSLRKKSSANASELKWLELSHADQNNLKNVTLKLPLGRLVVVTGVSGSGKSTLIKECLHPAVSAALAGKSPPHGLKLKGMEALKAVHEVDQSPIGRTPRSTPATYVGFHDHIRDLFASVPEARMRGYTNSRFSFNAAAGRCPSCEGAGVIKLEMNFLPPAHVKCEACGGARFNRETLDITYQGRNVAQVLDLSVAEALDYFAAQPKIRRPLEALRDTGLDYLKLGQTSPTLSGGEAQRVKLVSHLLGGLRRETAALTDGIRPSTRPNPGDLFILEEPTIGLHLQDVQRLVQVLQRLVDAGHSVVVIEHNLDLIAEADWVVDLGPEGGAAGGCIVAEGVPESIAATKGSHTGRYLQHMLNREK